MLSLRAWIYFFRFFFFLVGILGFVFINLFELFYTRCKNLVKVHLLCKTVQKLQNHLLKSPPFLHWIPFTHLSKIIWRWQWQPTPILLPGKSHGWRSLVGYSPWGCKESDRTEQLHFHFSLSCIGEGNGNPLQCSCLENPRGRGAWWAAIYGVAQSRTQLMRLSSSSSVSEFSLLFHWSIMPPKSHSLCSTT